MNFKMIWMLALAFFSSCGVRQSTFDALKEEHRQLERDYAELQAQKNELEKMANRSEAVIADTTIRELRSEINGQTYKIKVKFPKDYDREKKTYPTLYVIDAETNFGGVSYIAQRLIKDRLIPKLLIVGIAYGTDYDTFYKLRSRDLTPVEDKSLTIAHGTGPDPTGGGPLFLEFLEKELVPYIEQNFRSEPGERAIYGHSYGGLFGSYVLMNRPGLFNKYLLLSPSLWFRNNLLVNQVDKAQFDPPQCKVYMASGELEGRIARLQQVFVGSLEGKKLKGLQLKSEVMGNETHRTIFGPGFTNGLRFLYADGP